jgi:SAM-dependent methyltransferase
MCFKQPKHLTNKNICEIKKQLIKNEINPKLEDEIIITVKPDGLLTRIDFKEGGIINIKNSLDNNINQTYHNKHLNMDMTIYCEKVKDSKDTNTYLLFDIDIRNIEISNHLLYIYDDFSNSEVFLKHKIKDKRLKFNNNSLINNLLKDYDKYSKHYFYRTLMLEEVLKLFFINSIINGYEKVDNNHLKLSNTFIKMYNFVKKSEDNLMQILYLDYDNPQNLRARIPFNIKLNTILYLFLKKKITSTCNQLNEFHDKHLDYNLWKEEKLNCLFNIPFNFYYINYDGIIIYFKENVYKYKTIPTLKCIYNIFNNKLFTEDKTYVGKLHRLSRFKLKDKVTSFGSKHFNINSNTILEVYPSSLKVVDYDYREFYFSGFSETYTLHRIRTDLKKANNKVKLNLFIQTLNLTDSNLKFNKKNLNLSFVNGFYDNLRLFMRNHNFCYKIKKSLLIEYFIKLSNINFNEKKIKILDIGCGNDALYPYLKMLFQNKNINLTFLDKSEKVINNLNIKINKYKSYMNNTIQVRTINNNFYYLKDKNKYKYITLFNSIKKYDNKIISKLYNILEKDGYVVILFMNSMNVYNIKSPFIIEDQCKHENSEECTPSCNYYKIEHRKTIYEKKMFKENIIHMFQKNNFHLISNKNFNELSYYDFDQIIYQNYYELFQFYETLIFKKKSVNENINEIKNENIIKIFSLLNNLINNYLNVASQCNLRIAFYKYIDSNNNISLWKKKEYYYDSDYYESDGWDSDVS